MVKFTSETVWSGLLCLLRGFQLLIQSPYWKSVCSDFLFFSWFSLSRLYGPNVRFFYVAQLVGIYLFTVVSYDLLYFCNQLHILLFHY